MVDLSQLSKEDLVAMIAAMKASTPKARAVSMKVSEKGCISVYGGGLNFRGVHLYPSQWETIFAHAAEIRAFAKANTKELALRNARNGGDA